MRIAAFLGVKDEVELIERSILHLRMAGVDLIIAWDYDSKDGTSKILKSYESEEEFWIINTNEELSQPEEASLIMEYLAKANADWVVFLDADEFLIAATGDLKDSLSKANSEVLLIRRFNVVLTDSGPALPEVLMPESYESLILYDDSINALYRYIHENPNHAWIRGVPNPRVIARTEFIGGLSPGWHNITSKEDVPVRRSTPTDLLIAHLPFSTLSRFEKKVANIRKEFSGEPDWVPGEPQIAWHWRRWLVLADQGKLPEEFEHQVASRAELKIMSQAGKVRSAAELLSLIPCPPNTRA